MKKGKKKTHVTYDHHKKVVKAAEKELAKIRWTNKELEAQCKTSINEIADLMAQIKEKDECIRLQSETVIAQQRYNRELSTKIGRPIYLYPGCTDEPINLSAPAKYVSGDSLLLAPGDKIAVIGKVISCGLSPDKMLVSFNLQNINRIRNVESVDDEYPPNTSARSVSSTRGV